MSSSEHVLDPMPYDDLRLAWHGTGNREYWRIDSDPQCSKRTDEVSSGTGAGLDRIGAQPIGNGVYGLGPLELNENNAIKGTYAVTVSGRNQDYAASNPTTLAYDAIGLPLGGPLSLISPTEPGGNDYAGEHTLVHFEQERPGGMEVVEMKARWDLHRR